VVRADDDQSNPVCAGQQRLRQTGRPRGLAWSVLAPGAPDSISVSTTTSTADSAARSVTNSAPWRLLTGQCTRRGASSGTNGRMPANSTPSPAVLAGWAPVRARPVNAAVRGPTRRRAGQRDGLDRKRKLRDRAPQSMARGGDEMEYRWPDPAPPGRGEHCCPRQGARRRGGRLAGLDEDGGCRGQFGREPFDVLVDGGGDLDVDRVGFEQRSGWHRAAHRHGGWVAALYEELMCRAVVTASRPRWLRRGAALTPRDSCFTCDYPPIAHDDSSWPDRRCQVNPARTAAVGNR
jgi:hypothetical protein